MTRDPIVDEVRASRTKIWEECGGDLKLLMNRLRKAQEKHPERVITKKELDRQRKLERENAG